MDAMEPPEQPVIEQPAEEQSSLPPRRVDGIIHPAYRDPDNEDPYRGQGEAGAVSR